MEPLFREICEATKSQKENDRRALLMWHRIQRARGVKECDLHIKAPLYSIREGMIIVSRDYK